MQHNPVVIRGGSLGGPSNLVEFDLECVLYKCMRNKKSLLNVEVILTEIAVPCTCMYNDESLFVKKKIYIQIRLRKSL